jgi:hypothetical protein
MEQQAKRKPGRPSKGKRGNFTFRVTEKLRNELIWLAEQSGLSVSEEIEARLDRSINGEGIVAEVLGGPHNSALLLTLASAIRAVESSTGKRWTEDHETNLAIRAAVTSVMDLLITPPDVEEATRSKYHALLNFLRPASLGTAAAKTAVGKARQPKHAETTKEPKT